jgi:hypothetical protein
MRKLIVIASAIIAILFAVAMIIEVIRLIILRWPEMYSPPTLDYIVAIIGIIIPLLIILISLLVIFNIKIPKALAIPFAIISILIAIIYMTLLGGLLLETSISRSLYIFCSIVLIIFYLPAIITLLTYIRRALKPAEVKENK